VKFGVATAIWQSEADLDGFIEAFEAGTLPRNCWTHASHLGIGAAYALRYDEPEALQRLRNGIRQLNSRHGLENSDTVGYHESLTRFWLAIIRGFLRDYRLVHTRAQRRGAVVAVVKAFKDRRDMFRPYWSFDVLASVEARRAWIPPDLRSLPGTAQPPVESCF
jgi:hypothetical protein